MILIIPDKCLPGTASVLSVPAKVGTMKLMVIPEKHGEFGNDFQMIAVPFRRAFSTKVRLMI